MNEYVYDWPIGLYHIPLLKLRAYVSVNHACLIRDLTS